MYYGTAKYRPLCTVRRLRGIWDRHNGLYLAHPTTQWLLWIYTMGMWILNNGWIKSTQEATTYTSSTCLLTFFFLTKSACAIFLHYFDVKLQSMCHSCIYLFPFQAYSPHQSARLCLHQLFDEVALAQASLQSLLSAIRKMGQTHLYLPEELM